MDLFQRIKDNPGPLGKWADKAEGYWIFPVLSGPISNRMKFDGKEVICWSINNYLGLADHPVVRKADTEASQKWGLAYPMGSRMMSGETAHHRRLEEELAQISKKESAVLVNYGYQGIMSAISALLTRRDAVVFDADCHACIIDGIWMSSAKRFVYKHNDISALDKSLERATHYAEKNGGGILVITEGVFGMLGDQGKLREIVTLKDKYDFRLMVDDAHGFGTLGYDGSGAGTSQNIQDQIDIYFATFAKSLASIGAFLSGESEVIQYLKYNMRSQIFAKSLPLAIVKGISTRLKIMAEQPELRDRLWKNVTELQAGLKTQNFNLGKTNSCVTPVILEGSVEEAMSLVRDLRDNYDIFCSIVVYPVIPKGMILLRLIPTALHTAEDIALTISAFTAVRTSLKNKLYATS